MKNRIDEIDVLRGLLFLAIAFQHNLACFIYTPDISKGPALTGAFLLTLTRLAVPMFIFITGLVLFYNYGEGDFDYGLFIKKRFTQVFIPYFAWTLIYFIWTSLTAGTAPSTPGAIIGEIARLTITGDACYHLWFMTAILQFYLLYPLFRYLVLKTRNRYLLTLGLCFLAQIGLLYFYQHSAGTPFENIKSPLLNEIYGYRDRIFISWFFYFVLGGFAGLNVAKLPDMLRRWKSVIILVYFVSLFYVFSRMVQTAQTTAAGAYIINNMFSGPLNYSMAVFIVSSLMLVYYLSVTFCQRHERLMNGLETFGRYSLGCYFIHPLVIALLTAFMKTYTNWMGIILQIFVSFAACSILSLALCTVLNNRTMPCGRLLMGKVPPPPAAGNS